MTLPNGHQARVPSDFDAFGRWFERTFKVYVDNWQVWLLQGLVVFAITLGLLLVLYLLIAGTVLATVLSFAGTSQEPRFSPAALAVLIPAALLIWVAYLLVSQYLWAGMFQTALKQLRGEPTVVSDLFAAGWAVPGLVGLSIIETVLIFVGMLFCVIPGLVVAVLAMLARPLFVARMMGVGGSLSASFALVGRNFWLFALFSLVFSLLVGVIVQTGVGLIVGAVLWPIASAVIIADLYGLTPSPPEIPPPPPVQAD